MIAALCHSIRSLKSNGYNKRKDLVLDKYKFSNTERVSVWQAHKAKCFWCESPLELQHLTIDHIFPESLLSKPQELAKIKKDYSLPPEWSINSFANWVPAHFSCNIKKGIIVLPSSPAFILQLAKVQKLAIQCLKLEKKWKKTNHKNNLLAQIMAALENKALSIEEIISLTNEWPTITKENTEFSICNGIKLKTVSIESLLKLMSTAKTSIDIASPIVGPMFIDMISQLSSSVRIRALCSEQFLVAENSLTMLSNSSIKSNFGILNSLHAKFIVIDGRTVASMSSNLTVAGAASEQELMTIISQEDKVVRFQGIFEEYWARGLNLGVHLDSIFTKKKPLKVLQKTD